MVGTKGYPPHRRLSLEEKVEIIKEFERSKSRLNLGHLFHCHISQVNRTLQHKIELVSELKRTQQFGIIRKKRSACKVLQAVGIILNEFVLRCRSYPIELSDKFLLKKSVEIANIMNLSSFKGQKYWLKTFKAKFKLTEIDWSTWSLSENNDLPRKSLDLECIIEDLREEKGEIIIPHPKIMDEAEFQKTVQEMIATSEPYPGYMELISMPQSHGVEYQNIDENSVVTIISDEGDDMSSFTDSCEFDPTDLLSIENHAPATIDDPMNIDCYRTALSYFQPLEQFILAKRNDRVISVINQLGKALLRAVDAEEDDDQQMNDGPSCPSVINEVQIESYEDAVQYLHPLEEFVLDKMDMRAVGLINQLEILLNDELSKK